MQKIALAVLTFFAFVALVLEIISLATAAWLVSSVDSIGLWEHCIFGYCSSFIGTSLDVWFHWPTRIFAITSTLSLLAAVCHCLRVLFQNYPLDAWATARGLPGSFTSAAIMEVVALSFYTANIDLVPGVNWGYSYILGWCAVVMCVFLAIGSGFVIKRFHVTS